MSFVINATLADTWEEALRLAAESWLYGPGMTDADVAELTVTDEDVAAVMDMLDGRLEAEDGTVVEVTPEDVRDALLAVVEGAREIINEE